MLARGSGRQRYAVAMPLNCAAAVGLVPNLALAELPTPGAWLGWPEAEFRVGLCLRLENGRP